MPIMTVQQDYPCPLSDGSAATAWGMSRSAAAPSARPFQPAVMIAQVGARPIEIFGQASATEQAAGSAPVVLGAGSLADLAETLREGRPRDNFVAFLLPLSMKMLRASRRTLPAETLPANMQRPFHIELKSLCPGQAPKPQGAPVTGPQRGNAEAHYFGPVENGDAVLLIPRGLRRCPTCRYAKLLEVLRRCPKPFEDGQQAAGCLNYDFSETCQTPSQWDESGVLRRRAIRSTNTRDGPSSVDICRQLSK
jgi:hypothetical protein